MNKQTLEGTKRLVYALIKVVKYCTGSGAKSFQCKFAVHQALANKVPTNGKMGEAIREVINYPNIRGKFNSVHQDLKDLGVTKIEIGDNGIYFEGNIYIRSLVIYITFLVFRSC